MLKAGQTAIVTQDCELKKGEVVEIVGFSGGTSKGLPFYCTVYYKNIRFVVNANYLEPVKPERWKPEVGEPFFYVASSGDVESGSWNGCQYQEGMWKTYNVFSTREKALAERDTMLIEKEERYGE